MPLRVPVSSVQPFTHDVVCDLHLPDDSDGSLVVALHGMGQRVGSFTEDAVAITPPRAALIVPRGPFPFEKRRPEGPPVQAHAWYVWTGDQTAFLKSMERVSQWLLRVIDAQIAAAQQFGAELDSRRAGLVGFSQGGYLAGYLAVRNPGWFRACVVAAGRIKDEVLADAAPRAAAAGLRFLDVHGDQDEFVRHEACRASAERIAALGVPVDFRTYACGHDVLRHPQCRADVQSFLEGALANA